MKYVVTDDPRSPNCRIVRVREKRPPTYSEAYSFRRLDEWRRTLAASIWAWAAGRHLNAIERALHVRILAWASLFALLVTPILAAFWWALFLRACA